MSVDPFLAEIMAFAPNFAPRGWSSCSGQLLPISSNTALFSLIGTIYGGDGRTTTALPDLRGRAPIGVGPAPGMATYVQGQRVGQEYVTLTATQVPAHTHPATVKNLTLDVEAVMQGVNEDGSTDNPTDAVLAKPIYRESIATKHDVKAYVKSPDSSKIVAMSDQAIKTSTSNGSGTVEVGPSIGGGQEHENRTPSLVINWVIALQGVFPSRN